jgi:hypothetical protein
MLDSMGVKNIEAYGDSLLVVQQIAGNFQCLDGSLNAYLDKYLDIISTLDDFSIKHVSRADNSLANDLAQKGSGYLFKRGRIAFLEQPMLVLEKSQQPKPQGEVSGSTEDKDDSAMNGPEDWRVPIVCFLKNPNDKTSRKFRRQAIKFTLIGDDLSRRTIDGVLLNCLNEDETRVAMGEVHEGICGTHQLAHKMKWILRRAGFYWPIMISDCFK